MNIRNSAILGLALFFGAVTFNVAGDIFNKTETFGDGAKTPMSDVKPPNEVLEPKP